MDLLPQIYRRSGDNRQPLIEDYLKIFEKILTGEDTLSDDSTLYKRKGLGQTLNVLAGLLYPRFDFLFNPESTEFIPPIFGKNEEEHETDLNSYVGATYSEYNHNPESEWQVEFNAWLDEILDWMAQRIDLSLNFDWDADTRRYLIAYFMPYFRQRGTVTCLENLLKIFLGNGDPSAPLHNHSFIKDISVFDLSQCYQPVGSRSEALPLKPYQVGKNITLEDGYTEGQPVLGAQRPYAWLVRIVFKKFEECKKDNVNHVMTQFYKILEDEKPAIGCYNVVSQVPFMVGPDSATQLAINSYLLSS